MHLYCILKGRKTIMKKISALLLTIVLIFSMCTVAFAEEAQEAAVTTAVQTYKVEDAQKTFNGKPLVEVEISQSTRDQLEHLQEGEELTLFVVEDSQIVSVGARAVYACNTKIIYSYTKGFGVTLRTQVYTTPAVTRLTTLSGMHWLVDVTNGQNLYSEAEYENYSLLGASLIEGKTSMPGTSTLPLNKSWMCETSGDYTTKDTPQFFSFNFYTLFTT